MTDAVLLAQNSVQVQARLPMDRVFLGETLRQISVVLETGVRYMLTTKLNFKVGVIQFSSTPPVANCRIEHGFATM
jgi:hypothetical protein